MAREFIKHAITWNKRPKALSAKESQLLNIIRDYPGYKVTIQRTRENIRRVKIATVAYKYGYSKCTEHHGRTSLKGTTHPSDLRFTPKTPRRNKTNRTHDPVLSCFIHVLLPRRRQAQQNLRTTPQALPLGRNASPNCPVMRRDGEPHV